MTLWRQGARNFALRTWEHSILWTCVLWRSMELDYACADRQLRHLSLPAIIYPHTSDHLTPYPINIPESPFLGRQIWECFSYLLTWLPCDWILSLCKLAASVIGIIMRRIKLTWFSNNNKSRLCAYKSTAKSQKNTNESFSVDGFLPKNQHELGKNCHMHLTLN